MEKIAVLIPCYNEEKTIEKVIKDFRKELPEAKIYVYNNNSKDKTKDIAIMNNAIVVVILWILLSSLFRKCCKKSI